MIIKERVQHAPNSLQLLKDLGYQGDRGREMKKVNKLTTSDQTNKNCFTLLNVFNQTLT